MLIFYYYLLSKDNVVVTKDIVLLEKILNNGLKNIDKFFKLMELLQVKKFPRKYIKTKLNNKYSKIN